MKLKKYISIIIVIVLIICFVIGKNIYNQKKEKSDDKFEILTSFYPIYIMTLNVANGAEDVKVSNMAEKYTGCIHDYTLTTTDMKKFESCDIFIQNGAGLETFSDKILESYPKIKVVNAADGVNNFLTHNEDNSLEHNNIKFNNVKQNNMKKTDVERNNDENHKIENHSEDDEEVNSHIWLSISNYINEVIKITDSLMEMNSKNAKIYQKNCENYVNKLYTLKKKFDNLNLKNKKIINLNESLEYMFKENDIDSVLIETDHEQSTISANKIRNIIELMQNDKINEIYIDKNDSRKLADVLQNETNAKIYVLDSAMSGDGSLDSYINIMNQNYEILKEQE